MSSTDTLFVLNKAYKPQDIVKYESININALKYYLSNENLVKELDYPEDEQGFFRGGKKNLMGILKTYKKNIKPEGVQTIYSQSGNHKTGRFSVKESAGLQMIEKSIRHTLARGLYIDLDFKNCHPVILKQLCDFNKWDCENLTYYVNNRDLCINQLSNATGCSKFDAKLNILKILNGGRIIHNATGNIRMNEIQDNLKQLTWYSKLDKEITFIHKQIWDNYPEYAKIADNKPKKKIHNLLGSCFNHFITDIENQCLLAFEDFLLKNDFKPDVLCFDGIMVRIDDDNVITQETLIEAQEFIKNTTSFSLEIIEKVMDLYIELPKEEKIDNGMVNDNYACKIFCELMGDNLIYYNDTILIFNEENGIWTDKNSVILKAINKYESSLIFKRKTESGMIVIYDYGGNVRNINNMLKLVSNYIITNDTFWEDNIETSIGKLLFADGIYDYKTKKFTKGFNNKIVFKDYIPRNFPNPSKEKMDLVNKILFIDPFEDNGGGRDDSKFLKFGLARAIYGDYKFKGYYMLLGLSNSGKGVLMNAIKDTFCGYIKNFNSENLYYNKNSADEEIKNKWLLDICYARIAFTSEMDTVNKILNTVVLRKITSGGDENRARGLFKSAISFVNRSTMFLFCNECPPMKPYDEATQMRGNFIDMPFQFVEDPDPTNAIQKKGNNDIKKFFTDDNEAKDALVMIMINAYHDFLEQGNKRPEGVVRAEQEWNTESLSVERLLLEEYDFVKDDTKMIPFSILYDYIIEKKLTITKKKLGMEISALTGFKSVDKKVNKKTIKCCVGIIEKDDTYDM